MREDRLDNELNRLYEKFPYLWNDYGFHVRYLTRDYGMYYRGFLIGLENPVCKLIFEKETDSQTEPITEYIGKKHSSFTPPNYSYHAKDGWYSLPGLVYWISGFKCERDKNVDQDLDMISQYVKLHMTQLLELFGDSEPFDKKLEYYRNMNKDKQITVDKIREERARLQTLGKDSSLQAIITSLRGGKHE